MYITAQDSRLQNDLYCVEWDVKPYYTIPYPSVLWRCWLGNRKGIWPAESCMLVCWWWWFDFARLITPVVTTTSIILCSIKVQNGDILVPANSGPPGKMAVKTERESLFSRNYSPLGWFPKDHTRRTFGDCQSGIRNRLILKERRKTDLVVVGEGKRL